MTKKETPLRPKGDNGRSLDRFEDLLALMKEENLQELEIAEGDFHVRLVRQSKGHFVPTFQPAGASTDKSADAGSSEAEAEVGAPVKSPLAGVFYRSGSPNAPSFVKEGDVVSPDKVLCIIEAMKVMNEITAGVSGKITKILVENGKPVQNGQTLFVVDTGA